MVTLRSKSALNNLLLTCKSGQYPYVDIGHDIVCCKVIRSIYLLPLYNSSTGMWYGKELQLELG